MSTSYVYFAPYISLDVDRQVGMGDVCDLGSVLFLTLIQRQHWYAIWSNRAPPMLYFIDKVSY